MKPRTAGIRLIVLSLPFLAFGVLWAARPPQTEALGDATGGMRAVGVALALLGLAAMALGVWLVRRGEEKAL